jgi:phenylalanyl-tRNA synthetase beta subunit
LAFNIRFSSSERTLSEGEVAGAREVLIATGKRLGVVLR